MVDLRCSPDEKLAILFKYCPSFLGHDSQGDDDDGDDDDDDDGVEIYDDDDNDDQKLLQYIWILPNFAGEWDLARSFIHSLSHVLIS